MTPPKTVAIIDDDPSVRRSLARLLAAAGYAAAAFSSPAEFLVAHAAHAADCLLLDIDLGGVSGLDVARDLAAAGQRIPIIFISASTEAALRARAAELGCIAYLRKPFDRVELLDAVSRALAVPPSGP